MEGTVQESQQQGQTAVRDTGQQPSAPTPQTDFAASHQVKSSTVVPQCQMITSHSQPDITITQRGMTFSQSGVVIRVSPQLSNATRGESSLYRRKLTQRGVFSNDTRSTSLPRSQCGNSCGKTTTTKSQLSSIAQSHKNTLTVKSQLSVAANTSVDDSVFRRPLPVRRGLRGACGSTGPREPHKRRLFADDSNANKLRLQPVVLLRPLAHVVCTKKPATATDLGPSSCPSPAQSEFDLQLLRTATKDRDPTHSHAGQHRPTLVRSTGTTSPQLEHGGKTPRQSHSGRLVSRVALGSVVPHRLPPHGCLNSTDSDTGQCCMVYMV